MSPDAKTIAALREALDDEYRARATYRKVIDTFGPVRPFVNIVEAEDRHAKALLRLFERFGIEPPRDAWTGHSKAPHSLHDACRAGVEAEIENEAMYERMLKEVTDPSVRSVLQRLQRASKERHLPAFRRCLERRAENSEEQSRCSAGRPRRDRVRRRAG